MRCQVCKSEISDGLKSCPVCGSVQQEPKKQESKKSLLDQMLLAQSLIHAIPRLQKRIDDLSYQIESQKEVYVEKKNGKMTIVVAVLISLVLAYFVTYIANLTVQTLTTRQGINNIVYSRSLNSNVSDVLSIVVFVISFIVSRKFITKHIDKKNAAEKERVEKHNADVEKATQGMKEEIEDATARVFSAQKTWLEECAPWYPMDYCDIASVDFFVAALRNHRADSIKALVNLWEQEKRYNTAEAQRAQAAAQQEAMVTQQIIGNLLSFGSLLVQGKMLNNQKDIANKLGNIDFNTKNIAWDTGQFSNRNRSISQQVMSNLS